MTWLPWEKTTGKTAESDYVRKFLPKWRTATPLPRRITLRLWDGLYEQMSLGDEKELQAACEEAGWYAFGHHHRQSFICDMG